MSSATRTLPLLALLACGDSSAPETPEAASAEHQTRGTLVVGYQADLGNLIPVVSEMASDSDLLNALSVPLIDSEFDCSLKKLPGVATEWSWSDDGKVLSMTLRDDITFEDGTPVTADDIAFTYELIADPTVASPRVSYIEHMVEDARPKVVDATHIEWHFTKAYDRDSQVSHAAGLEVMSRKHFGDADRQTLRGHPRSKEPMSYGPWRLSKWDPNNRIVLEPNPKYTGPEERKANLNRVIFRVLPEYSTRLLELEQGNIDMMEQVGVEDADRLRKEHPEIKLHRRGWRSNDYIAWNLKNPLFADKKVRQALAHAVDIESMIAKLLTSETGEAYARPSVGTITPALCGVHNDDIVPLSHNAAQAKAMLAEAGWTDSNGDGVLDKDGKKFQFTLATNTGNKRRADIQVLVQAQLQAIGIVADLEKAETNAFYENLRNKNFEAAIGGWAAGLFIDPSALWACDTEEKQYLFNFTSYCNPEVDALIDQGLNTPDPVEAAPIWKELQAKIYDDQPYLFLWWNDEIVAVHERFENTDVNVLSSLHNLHNWSVPEDKVKYKR